LSAECRILNCSGAILWLYAFLSKKNPLEGRGCFYFGEIQFIFFDLSKKRPKLKKETDNIKKICMFRPGYFSLKVWVSIKIALPRLSWHCEGPG
jgi:hypothetical protein